MPKHSYLIKIQYLGFRYHGWMKQGELRTVQLYVEKTLKWVLQHNNFRTMGSSRTDARVSANRMAFQLTMEQEIENENAFLYSFDENLPADIRALSISKTPQGFDPINAAAAKEYLYLFCHGPKPHPFCTALMGHFTGHLDIELMKKGAQLFEGEHNFKQYCTKPTPGTQTVRRVDLCRIEENEQYTASFFPKQSYLLRIKGPGFMRYQIRLMMARLVDLGRGEIDLNTIPDSLSNPPDIHLPRNAPGSGLILESIEWNDKLKS